MLVLEVMANVDIVIREEESLVLRHLRIIEGNFKQEQLSECACLCVLFN